MYLSKEMPPNPSFTILVLSRTCLGHSIGSYQTGRFATSSRQASYCRVRTSRGTVSPAGTSDFSSRTSTQRSAYSSEGCIPVVAHQYVLKTFWFCIWNSTQYVVLRASYVRKHALSLPRLSSEKKKRICHRASEIPTGI